MAELGDRGQMLLIGAVVLAVTFVSLAIVLNGSINTTTVASEASADVSASKLVAYQNDVRRNTGTVMQHAFESDSSPKLNADQKTDVENTIDNQLAPKYQSRFEQHGAVTDLGYAAKVDGYYHHQDRRSQFIVDEDGDGTDDANWDLTTDSQIREFTIDVRGWGDGSSDDFTITITPDTGSSTDIVIHEDGGSGAVVEVDGEPCPGSSSLSTTVDLTAGSVGGTPCPALDFIDEMDGPYDVHFENGNEIEGTYGVVTTGGGHGASVQERLYAVELDLSYQSPTVAYESTIRVAPGEPR